MELERITDKMMNDEDEWESAISAIFRSQLFLRQYFYLKSITSSNMNGKKPGAKISDTG